MISARSGATGALRVQRQSALAVLLVALGSHAAWSQPLLWSPQRSADARPIRSLQALAAEQHVPGDPIISLAGRQGLLIRNPDTADGTPDFALADEYGQIQRYIEPSPGVDLAAYVGERVGVRSDTGTTLLASQLDLPAVSEPGSFGVVQAQHQAAAPSPQVQPLPPIVRTAQVPPVMVDQHGGFAGSSGCTCPNCTVNHYGTPVTQGYVTPYDQCTGCQTYAPYTATGTAYGPSCGLGARGRIFARAEYLLWRFDGMHVPPLVTSSPPGTPQAEAGVLGEADTTILYGNGEILGGRRDGLRFSAGVWLNDYQDIAVEGDVLLFETQSEGFQRTGIAGAPILARPFFNMVPIDGMGEVLPPADDAELVSFPGVVEGTVSVSSRSEFGGAGLRLRGALCCKELGGAYNAGGPCAPGVAPWGVSRIDAIGGYRYLRLDERIVIREELTSLLSTDPGNFDLYDRFSTSNDFHGGDVGFVWELETTKWSFELLTKMAIGSTNQRVSIRGETTVSNDGTSFTSDGGLLALDSNIGTYQRDVFTVIPELGVAVGYKVTPRLRLTAGYSLLYWARATRPGDHIDLDVNPNLLPPAVEPLVGPERPGFQWHDTALLAHGLNVGLDYRF